MMDEGALCSGLKFHSDCLESVAAAAASWWFVRKGCLFCVPSTHSIHFSRSIFHQWLIAAAESVRRRPHRNRQGRFINSSQNPFFISVLLLFIADWLGELISESSSSSSQVGKSNLLLQNHRSSTSTSSLKNNAAGTKPLFSKLARGETE